MLKTGPRFNVKYPLSYSNYNKAGQMIDESVNTPESNDGVAIVVTASGTGSTVTQNYTVTDDFILQSLQMKVSSGSIDKSGEVQVKGVIVARASCIATGVDGYAEVTFDNWLIKAGEILTAISHADSSHSGSCAVSFRGIAINK